MRKIGLLAALVLLAALPVRAQIYGVTAKLKLDQTQYLPGEDIQLKVRILNRSGQQITLGTDKNWIALSISDENNRMCAMHGEMPVQGEFSLLSGEVGTKALNPAPYFEFPRMGRYHATARIHIAQWNQDIACKSVTFTIAQGVPLPNLANLQFGLPSAPGVTNTAPEVRSYSLLKVSDIKELKLYFRLSDSSGKILRVEPLARMISFSEPEAQIDRFNNLHVLSQIGARSFAYCVLGPDGQWVARQTHIYTETRPVLRISPDGRVFVANGARRFSPDDYPPSAPESANVNRQ